MGVHGALSSAASTGADAGRARNSAVSARVAQRLVVAILEILIQAPALDLREGVVELLARKRAVIEPLATAELRIVPRTEVLEFSRHRDLPSGQPFRQIAPPR